MIKLIKLLKSLKAQGFASKDAKAEVIALVKEVGDEAEVVAEEVAEVEALPEEAPVAEDKGDVEEMVGKIFSKTAVQVEAKMSDKLASEVKSMKEDLTAFVKKATTTKSSVPTLAIDAKEYETEFSSKLARGQKADLTV
jgi:hypothetical protein